jgi:hypothetical protein
MDVLEQYLSGGKATAAPPPSNIVNNPGNLRPMGASTGFQNFATPEEGISAADKNLKAYGDKGINTLRGVINRWAPPSENDTNTYIDTVAKKIGLDPDQKIDLTDPVQRHVISGAMFTVEKGSKNLFKSGQQAAVSQTTQPVSSDPLENFFAGKKTAAVQPSAQPPAQPGQPAPAVAPVVSEQNIPSKIADIAAQTFNRYQDVKRNLGERVAGAVDTAYGIVPQLYGAGVQAIARTANTPQRAEEIGQAAAASIDKPLGKAMGITGSEAYQKPLGGITEPIAQQVNKMFNVLGMTPEQISEKTGIPPEDIRNMVVIGSAAVPQVLKETGQAIKVSPVGKKIGEAAKELEIVRPGQLTKEQMQAQFEAAQGKAGSVGAAAAQNNPYFGKITGEETVRGQFPQVKLSKTPTDVPINEQMLRSQIAQEIMPGGGVRPGVITGNENLLRNEYTKAKLDTPEGQLFKQQIANEQTALSNYAQERVNATGASRSLINDEQRGERINNVFHGVDPEDMSGASITGYLNQAKKQIYDSAFNKVGNNQIKTTHLDNFVNDPQEISTFKAAGQGQLLEGAKELIELAKTTGFKMRDGTVLPPGSVAAYDHVRKVFNSPKIWNRDRASFIRDINGAIDQDIAAVADPALYKLGDNIHKLEKNLFKSKGIDKVFGEVDQNGVLTSATALEKIPQKLNNMPKDQWRHIRDTLNDLANGKIRNAPEGMPPIPPELMQSARAAVAEIDGALAREVQKAGASKIGEWNQNSANNVMNSVVGQKILETFPPEEVRKFHTLNYAGHLMPGIHSYEGAALQGRRVGIIERNLPAIGAAAGGAVGGFFGEVPGAAFGTFAGRELGARRQAKQEIKAAEKAADKAKKEMEEAAKLGKQTGQNKASDMLNKK